ncbi:MAG: hypothetical protein FWC26_04610 [Fibromonadales bacterium]|nr:hypothetical protein [Fibromonadales bacterium]
MIKEIRFWASHIYLRVNMWLTFRSIRKDRIKQERAVDNLSKKIDSLSEKVKDMQCRI